MFKELYEFLLMEGDDINKLNLVDIRDSFNKLLFYNEMGHKKPTEIMNDLYKTFSSMFSYEGVVYRGISSKTKELRDIKTDELLSFTTNKNTAENFALRENKGYGYLLTQEVKGLYFVELLVTLEERGILLSDDIFCFINEDEILCFIEEDYKSELKFELY